MELVIENLNEVKKAAKEVLKELLKNKKRPLVLALTGELGSGKTTFVQGLAKLLGVREQITSPTFLLVRFLELPKKKNKINQLVHIDTYRLHNGKELIQLGLKDILNNENNLVVIEWPEKIKRYLPKQTLYLNFEVTGPKRRKIKITI